MAQQHAFGAVQLVVIDVVREAAEVLEHLAHDALGPDVLLPHPGMLVGELVEGVVDEVAAGLGVLQLVQLRDALLIRHAFVLHRVHRLGLHLVELTPQNDVGILQDGFAERDHIRRVVRRSRVNQGQRVDEVERERVVQREVILKLHVEPELVAVLTFSHRNDLHDLALHQRPEELPRTLAMRLLRRRRFMRVLDQLHHRMAAVARAAEHLQQHAVRDLEA